MPITSPFFFVIIVLLLAAYSFSLVLRLASVLYVPSRCSFWLCGLMVDKLLANVGPSRLDEGVKLGEEGDGPHEVAADEGEDEGGAPEAVGEKRLVGG